MARRLIGKGEIGPWYQLTLSGKVTDVLQGDGLQYTFERVWYEDIINVRQQDVGLLIAVIASRGYTLESLTKQDGPDYRHEVD